MAKIDLNRLKSIIREEMSNLREGDDHDAASKVMSSAAKLLGAIETFEEAATEKVKVELGEHLEAVEKLLNRVINSPMQYIVPVAPKGVVKKVSLKPAQEKVM